MKKTFIIAGALCLAILLFTGPALASDSGGAAATIDSTIPAEPLPVDVLTSANRLEICKIYELSPSVDPGLLPRGSFERSGYLYECVDILREVVIGEEFKTVTVTESAESAKNDMDTVLGLFPQHKEYADADGFAGSLLLNTATIRAEISGYGSSSTPYTVSRSYPNLSDTDTQHIPKAIDDGGRSLQLQDIQWQTDNTYNADDYEIGNRYTALATYGGTRTSSYVRGYDLTADYTGEVSRKGVTVIRYTVIFIGSEAPAPDPAQEPTPAAPAQPEEPTAEPEPEPVPDNNKSGGGWLPTLLSILALLGCGACGYFIMKNRKEPSLYEKEHIYDYPDTYAGDADDASDDSAGDGEV